MLSQEVYSLLISNYFLKGISLLGRPYFLKNTKDSIIFDSLIDRAKSVIFVKIKCLPIFLTYQCEEFSKCQTVIVHETVLKNS